MIKPIERCEPEQHRVVYLVIGGEYEDWYPVGVWEDKTEAETAAHKEDAPNEIGGYVVHGGVMELPYHPARTETKEVLGG